MIPGNSRIDRILLSVSFILTALSVLQIWLAGSSGYEVSIYQNIPVTVWMFLFISSSIAIIRIVYKSSVQSGSGGQSPRYGLDFLVVLLNFTIFLSLPLVKGYAFWGRGDPLTHLGIIKGVIDGGVLQGSDFYPVSHIFGTAASLMFGIPPETVLLYVPLIFGVLFILYMYVFARVILPRREQVALSVLASTTFVTGWFLNYTSNHLANLMIPLIFYTFFSSLNPGTAAGAKQFKLLTVILLIIYTPFHPVPSIAILAMLVVTEMLVKSKLLDRYFPSVFPSKYTRPDFFLVILFGVWLVTWISSYNVWDKYVTIASEVLNEDASTSFSALSNKAAYASSMGYNVYEHFFRVYFVNAAFILLAIVAILLIFRNIKTEKGNYNLFLLGSAFLAFIMIPGIFFGINVGFSPLRFLIYPTILSIPLAGYLLSFLFSFLRTRNIHIINLSIVPLVALFFILSLVMGTASLYPSPYVKSVNHQVTLSELQGMAWYFSSKDDTLDPLMIGIDDYRFADALLPRDYRKDRRGIAWSGGAGFQPPYHFNYESRQQLGESYQEDRYLLISTLGRLYYTEAFPEMEQYRWGTEDFTRLEGDRSIDKLFASQDLEIRLVEAIRG